MTVGEKIKYFRTLQEMTQKTLGTTTGIGESTLRKYELGIRNPKLAQLKRIAQALGVSVRIFLDSQQYETNIETDEDYIRILLTLINSNIVKIDGERSDDGFIKPNTMSLHIDLNIQFMNFFNFYTNCNSTEKSQIALSDISLKVINPVIINPLIKWEKINHQYNCAIKQNIENPGNTDLADISELFDTKEKLELELYSAIVSITKKLSE